MKKQRSMTIFKAMRDPVLFGPWFKGDSWQAWHVFLSALFGLPMDKAALETCQRHTGRKSALEGPCKEGWLVVGRRGGKSLISALTAVFWSASGNIGESLHPVNAEPSC